MKAEGKNAGLGLTTSVRLLCAEEERSIRAKTQITVVAAVISDGEGRILLARRPKGSHMAGLWEFPGGKVEEGESFSEALARELDEELGIVVEIGGPLTFAVHTEPDLEILLLFFSGVIATGVPTPREGQELRWVRPDELRDFPMPPADDEVVELLTAQPLAIINRHDADREPRAPTAKPGAP